MDPFLTFLDNFIIETNNLINEKIIGINYLEKIKFPLIEKLIILDKNIIEDFKSELLIKGTFSKKHDFKHRLVNYYISYYGESVSKIKHIIEKDTLSIVLEGTKTISIFEKNKQNKSVKINIIRNMGLVISQKTVINENINKKSIILTIMNE